MLSDEEKEIFNNLREYMQSKIDNGYHKFIYNDLDWDFKCIDCINAIDNALKQSKEIEKLKEKIKTFKIEDENIYLQFGEITEKKRWQDKIKAKLKELKHEKSEYEDSPKWEWFDYLTAQIEVLESLLKEE